MYRSVIFTLTKPTQMDYHNAYYQLHAVHRNSFLFIDEMQLCKLEQRVPSLSANRAAQPLVSLIRFTELPTFTKHHNRK